MIQSLAEAYDMAAKGPITLPEKWRPREDQQNLWNYLNNGGKRAVQVAHRRWGKDEVALNFTSLECMEQPATYWHMLPKYDQARKVVWTAINPHTGKKRIDEAFPLWTRAKTRENEMSIEFITGSVWQLVGSDNYDSIVGAPPRGIVFSEWAIANPLAWGYLSPILEENDGWALFIYTSRGNNHGKTMYQHARATDGWHAELIDVDHSPVFRPDQIQKIREEYRQVFGTEIGDLLFLQEYYCSFEGAVYGSYLAKQMVEARSQGRITSLPWMPGYEVDTFWDLGVDDSMTIWFIQIIGHKYHIIDYYEASGYGLEHYAKVLKEKPYTYGNHYLPHDAEVREQTNGEIAKSRREVAENLGIRPITVVERARNMDVIMHVHIPAMRNILAQCWFDEKKCSQGIMALESYKAEYDEKKKILSPRPAHDWASHGADSFRTFAVTAPTSTAKRAREMRQSRADFDYDPFGGR